MVIFIFLCYPHHVVLCFAALVIMSTHNFFLFDIFIIFFSLPNLHNLKSSILSAISLHFLSTIPVVITIHDQFSLFSSHGRKKKLFALYNFDAKNNDRVAYLSFKTVSFDFLSVHAFSSQNIIL